jgi:O-antigen ligase
MMARLEKPSWVAGTQRWVFVLLAWSLPLSLFGMQVGMILGALCVLGWVVWTRFAGFRSPLDVAFLTLLAAVFWSLLPAVRGIENFQATASFWVWFTFFVAYHGLDSKQTLRLAVHGLLVLSVAAAAFGIFQSFTGLYPLGDVIHSGQDTQLEPVGGESGLYTAVGFFKTRVTFAHMLLFPFCWLAALALQPLKWRVRLLLFVGLCVVGIGMVCTWRRTAPVAGIVALLGLIWVQIRNRKMRWIATGLAAVVVVVLCVGLAPGLVQRIQKSFLGGGDWGRMTIYQTALDMASERPVTGFGFGSFQQEARPRVEARLAEMGRTRFSGKLTWAHNDLLTFWAECGILGAFAFCLLLVAYFLAMRRGISKIPEDDHWLRGFARGSAAAVAVFMLTGIFHDHFFHGAELGFVLWFTLGASLAAVREEA